jgi:hypothetical protein
MVYIDASISITCSGDRGRRMMGTTDVGNSRIFYRGPSQLDQQPILGVITGLSTPSTNTKTGDMLQTYILREDVSPPDAVALGTDRSICGKCPLRGDGNGLGRACYVNVSWAPLSVWKYIRREVDLPILFQRSEFAGRFLRLGSYGDPTAIPLDVWNRYLPHVAGWTGYTHQWRDPRFIDYQSICMASVDSIDEYHQARLAGWRTFRVRGSVAEALHTFEITCPASAEAGHRTTCAACQLCNGCHDGDDRKHITIIAHGSRASKRGMLVLPFDED